MRKAKTKRDTVPQEPEAALVTRAEVAAWARGLATMLSEGKSIVPALVVSADRESNPQLQNAIRDLAARVRGGESLSQAMAHQDEFAASDVEIVRLGEDRNTLVDALSMISEEAESSGEPPVISVVEVAEFSRQFAALVSDGVSLVRAMATLEEQQTNPEFKRIIHDINAEVQAGQTLSNALRQHPAVFSEDYINAVRSGEISGTLDWTLHGLTHYDDILTFDQATQFLGTSKATLYRLLNEEKLKGLRVGRQWRFRKVDLAAYLEKKPHPTAHGDLEGIEDELKYFESLIRPPKDTTPAQQDSDDGEHRVVTLVNRILRVALEAGASDIHLEMTRLDNELVLLLRHRIDGLLHEIRRLPEKLSKPIFNRFKVMADIGLEERALPQDGRVHLKFEDKDFNLLVNWMPASQGGSLVMRILDQSHPLPSFEQIEMEASDRQRWTRWCDRPHGLIVASGPTGSGKLTMLYSLLEHKASPGIKIVTVEDPVERTLPYATQVSVNRKAGLTIPAALRAVLRQDPDLILLSELPDPESAELAHHAALTGHLVFSTLPTASAADAVRQLIDSGISPFIVSSTLVGASSQRLVRRICPDCSEDAPANEPALRQLCDMAAAGGYEMPPQSTFRHGRGCDKCRGMGYRGRLPLFELMEIDATLSAAIARNASRDELEALAVQGGMTTLAADGARKAVQGMTTIEEVLRILFIGSQLVEA